MARRKSMDENRLKWFLITPTVIILLFWVIYPLLWSLGLSFYNYSVMQAFAAKPTFVGIQNYLDVLSDPVTWSRFQVTARFVVLAVSVEFVIGFILALLLIEEFRGKRIIITTILIPMMAAPIAIGVFFRFVLDETFGVTTYFLSLFGLGFKWYTPTNVIPSVVLVDAWMWSPFMMLIILAGLTAVPKYLYEAADIDRASWWMKFRYITVPTIKPILAIALLFRTMDAFKLFDLIFILTDGGPGGASETISLHLYRIAFQYFYTGKGSALAYVLLVIIIVLSNIYVRFLTRRPVETFQSSETIVEV